MSLTEAQRQEIAREAVERAELSERLRISQLPANLNEAQLRSRIQRAQVEAQRRQESIDYHSKRRDQELDEIEALQAELRSRKPSE